MATRMVMMLLDFWAAAPLSWGTVVEDASTEVTTVLVERTLSVEVDVTLLSVGAAGGVVVVEVVEVVVDVVDVVPLVVVPEVVDVVEVESVGSEAVPEVVPLVVPVVSVVPRGNPIVMPPGVVAVVAVVDVPVDKGSVVLEEPAPGMGAAPITGPDEPSPGKVVARFLRMRFRLTWSRCCSGASWLASTTVETATRTAREIKSVVESFRVLRASMVIV